MKLDPQSLRLFISVLEEGTIAAASQREHIAAAAVSRRLSELESLLGSQLLIRSNKGIDAHPRHKAPDREQHFPSHRKSETRPHLSTIACRQESRQVCSARYELASQRRSKEFRQ